MTDTTKRILRVFLKNKLGLLSFIVLGVLYLGVLFSGFIAPYSYVKANRNYIYASPTKIHFINKEGKLTRPFIYRMKKKRNPVTLMVSHVPDTSKEIPIQLFVRGHKYKFWGLFKTDLHLFGVDKKYRAMINLFGTDNFGRDLFSRIIYGSRVSMSICLVGALISVVLGALIGAFSGYYGGWIDVLIQRFIELLRSFPQIPLWFALAMILPPNWPSTWVYCGIVIVLSFIGWMGVARIVRGMTLALREREFVLASKVMGASGFRIVVGHLLPNMTTYLIVVLTLTIPSMILGESALSFLGLGIKEPMTSWGLLLKNAQSLSAIESQPWLLIPGLFIVIVVVAFNFLGNALSEAADPYKTAGK